MTLLSLPFLSLSVLLLCASSSQASGPVTSCCLKTQGTRIALNRLLKYHIQNGVCTVKAVQFTTIRDITICADPSDPWTQKAIKHLDAKKTPVTKTNPTAALFTS